MPASTGTVPRKYTRSTVHEDGNEVVIDSVEQVPREKVLKYLPIGNYKWCVFLLPLQRAVDSSHKHAPRSAIEVDTSRVQLPIARLELVINGKISYRHTIEGSSIPRSMPVELGTFVPALRDMLLKLRVNPRSWFF